MTRENKEQMKLFEAFIHGCTSS